MNFWVYVYVHKHTYTYTIQIFIHIFFIYIHSIHEIDFCVWYEEHGLYFCFLYEYIIDLAQFSGNNTLFHLSFSQIK